MSIKSINGLILEKMVKNGLNNIRLHEKEINDMNVFPVADGDTGRNMRLTLENGVKSAKTTKHLGEYLKMLSEGMLFGARGNSGVILSQLFKGFYNELAKDGIVNPYELRDALISGYRNAYKAVMRPVEGTILTVAREAIENTKTQFYRGSTIEDVLSLYITEARESLKRTPDLLGVLKEADVVDSGAYGYIVIMEGMLKALYGEMIEVEGEPSPAATQPKVGHFDENSPFTLGYCMEFLLQLQSAKHFERFFNRDKFAEDVAIFGNSLVVIREGTIVKVHIHTLKPAKIISIAQEYGEFISFKLENMQLQHTEVEENKQKAIEATPKKAIEKLKKPAITALNADFASEKGAEKLPENEFAFISCVDGEGIKEELQSFGCELFLDLSEGVSVENIVNAAKAANAKTVAVFPNDPNVIFTAEQAASLCTTCKIVVIPTKNVLESYFAIQNDVPDANAELRIKALQRGYENVQVISSCTAVKDYKSDNIECKTGDSIAIKDGEIIAVASDRLSVIKNAAEGLEEGPEAAVVIFYGANADPSEAEDILEALTELFDGVDVALIFGGQKVFDYIIGII